MVLEANHCQSRLSSFVKVEYRKLIGNGAGGEKRDRVDIDDKYIEKRHRII